MTIEDERWLNRNAVRRISDALRRLEPCHSAAARGGCEECGERLEMRRLVELLYEFWREEQP